MNPDAKVAEFEANRSLLQGLAYRMLGSVVTAQDVVQDTYMRWDKTDAAQVRSPKAWLTTTCTRIAMDELKICTGSA